jgi:tripartite-type tricarboxylate transporter receptor subunit TctC
MRLLMKSIPQAQEILLTRRSLLAQIGKGIALSALPLAGFAAQTFPSKPVRFTTPFPAGSGPDAALRVLAEQLSKRWSQPVIVENKPGGNGFIAVAAFKQGKADGHDLIQLDSNHITTHPHTFSKLPYNVEQDFMPLSMILHTPFFVVVAADSPYKTIDDLLAAAKVKNDRVMYGSWFNGSPGHIGALLLQQKTGTQMTHVPYRDFGGLYLAVANKEVDWAFGSVASAGALERSGKLRFIMLASDKREALYPNVPCSGEIASVKGLNVNAWSALFAPAGLPANTRTQLASDIKSALTNPTVVANYRTFGYEAPLLSFDEINAQIKRETASWQQIIKNGNLKLD